MYNSQCKSKGRPLSVVTYSRLRQNLARMMDQVSNQRAPLIVTRSSGGSVVMLSLEEYEGMSETAHLLRSPANARRLLKSVAAADRGALVARPLPGAKPARSKRARRG